MKPRGNTLQVESVATVVRRQVHLQTLVARRARPQGRGSCSPAGRRSRLSWGQEIQRSSGIVPVRPSGRSAQAMT